MYTWDNVAKVWDEAFQSVDLTRNVDWLTKTKHATNHENMSVPPNLSPRDFIEYICVHIINEPRLCGTAAVQSIIRDCENKIMSRGGLIKPFTYGDALKAMEGFLNTKIVFEDLRLNPHKIPAEDFLNVRYE